MPRITDENLAQIRTKHPRGVKVLEVALDEEAAAEAAKSLAEGQELPVDEFVFRKIDRASHTKYRSLQKRSMVHGGGGDEATLLARELLVWPTVQDFDALRERAPAITEDFGHALLADAAAGLEVREGKR